MHKRNVLINRIIWLILCMGWGIIFLLSYWTGMEIHILYLMSNIATIACFLSISVASRFFNHSYDMYLFGHTASQILISAIIISILQYFFIRLNCPTIDLAIIKADTFLGFDWQKYVAASTKYHEVATTLEMVYFSSVPLLCITICVLFAFKKTEQVQRVMVTYLFAGLMSVIIVGLWPTIGPYAFYHYDPLTNPHPQIVQLYLYEAKQINAVRAHQLPRVEFPNVGIIFFPSFHAVLTVIIIYASWFIPWVKYVNLAICFVMFLSIPFVGGHYLMDIIAGILIAGTGIYIAEKCLPRAQLQVPRLSTPEVA